MKLRHLKGATWAIEGLTFDADTLKKLEHLPGLTLEPKHGRVSGYPDAVGAACGRLGLQDFPTIDVRPRVEAGVALRSYQASGVNRLLSVSDKMGSVLLADEMGLGKSRQAITFAQVRGGRVLIACPALARETWGEELQAVGVADEDIAILRPAVTKKDKAEWEKAPKARYVVSSYDLLDRARLEAFPNSGPTTFIMDEVHQLKGRDAGGRRKVKASAVEAVAALTPYKVMITGTPQWDRPRDWWRLLKIMYGKAFGSSFDFDVAYCAGVINAWGGLDNKGVSRADELRKRLDLYMVRRTKAEVAKELPALTRQVVWIDPTDEVQRAYHSVMMGGQKASGQQLAHAMEVLLEAKIKPAMELAVQARRFLLVTHRKSHAHQMAKVLAEQYDTPCVCVTGDIDTVKRQALIRQAQSAGWGVVATIDSVYAAINMQGIAEIGIAHAFMWEPMKLTQMEARLHRLGTKNPIQWVYVAMRDSMDVMQVRTVVQKLDQQMAVMGQEQTRHMRDDLGDAVDGAGAEAAEKAALAALYEAMD